MKEGGRGGEREEGREREGGKEGERGSGREGESSEHTQLCCYNIIMSNVQYT